MNRLTANVVETERRMQVLVIGAGVVGLAVARAAARKGHEVVVAEAANAIGTGISSRNSEVIHGGMYYADRHAARRATACAGGAGSTNSAPRMACRIANAAS